MAAPNYDVITLPLATARNRVELVRDGLEYDGVVVIGFPAGGVASLALGASRQLVPIGTQGQAFELVDRWGNSEPATEGLYVTTPGGGVGDLVLFVNYPKPLPRGA